MKHWKNQVKNLAGLFTVTVIIVQVVVACSDATSTVVPLTASPAPQPATPIITIAPTAPATATQAVPTVTVPVATVTATKPVPAATPTRPAPTATPSLAAVAPEIKGVTPSAAQVGRYNKFELTIDLKAAYNNPFDAAYNNPFDPDQLDLHATFTSPGGTSSTVPGFFWQNYTSQLSGKKEVLTPEGQATWKVRFSPTEVGQWTYLIEVVTPGGTVRTNPAKVEVVDSDNPGYLRVSQQDSSYLKFSTGKPYFAVGQNVGWYGEGGTHDYENWFKQMSSNGANFARIWMASWALGIEWSDGSLGDYSKRLDRAWQLDQVFDLAEQNNLYLVLSLLNHGAFSKTTNPEWDKNPYNATLGGPCAEPQDFATNPQARELFKRRLRYIAARWGYSTHLLAWEWWNEVDYTPINNRALLKPWIEEMTAALRGWEGFPHLKTTSYGRSVDETIYKMPEIDLVQRHEYAPQDSISTFPRNMAALRALNKPALYGELGIDGSSADGGLDKWGIHLHNGLWASLMTKGFGTSMNWWWDNYVDPLSLYSQFKGPATFVQDENLAAAHYEPIRLTTGSNDYAALIMKSDKRILGWVKNEAYSYQALKTQYENFLNTRKQKTGIFDPAYPAVGNAVLKLTDLAPGNYKVEWWSTQGKGILQTTQVVVKDSTFSLHVPEFNQDIAFKLILGN